MSNGQIEGQQARRNCADKILDEAVREVASPSFKHGLLRRSEFLRDSIDSEIAYIKDVLMDGDPSSCAVLSCKVDALEVARNHFAQKALEYECQVAAQENQNKLD